MSAPGGITERRAARAARQLLYHRERLAWMEERMEENLALLETYLVAAGEDRAIVAGGYVLALSSATPTAPVAVERVPRAARADQLRLDLHG